MRIFGTLLTLLLSLPALSDTVLLNSKNTLTFKGIVDSASVVQMQLELAKLVVERGGKDYPIYLVLDCPGGSIYDGEQFIQFAKTVPNLKTISLFAASMCSGIVEGLPGDRLITDNGILMFHRARGEFSGQFEEGEVESQLKFWKAFVGGMEQRNADRMKLSLPEYKNKIKDELWLYGKDAVKQNAADKTVDILCSADLINSKSVQLIRGFLGTLKVTFSKCPTIRTPLNVEE